MREQQAVKSNRHDIRSIPFYNTEQLIDDLKTMYPAVKQISIIDLDDRDEEFIPKTTIRKMRSITITKTYYTLQWKRTPKITFSGSWKYLIVIVEKGAACCAGYVIVD